MTVGQLIAILESYDPDSTVLMLQQPTWPFEYTISGVCERADFSEPEDLEGSKKQANDVFILEGSQLRYGHKDAWECARRF